MRGKSRRVTEEGSGERVVSCRGTVGGDGRLSVTGLGRNLSLGRVRLLTFSVFDARRGKMARFRGTSFRGGFGLAGCGARSTVGSSSGIADIGFDATSLRGRRFGF